MLVTNIFSWNIDWRMNDWRRLQFYLLAGNQRPPKWISEQSVKLGRSKGGTASLTGSVDALRLPLPCDAK